MKFSFVVPVYNTAAHLPACIESMLAQTVPDFEVLLIDDGSTDDSPAVCREFAARDSRVRFFPRPHAGVSAARNHGLALARGEFVTFIDSDDTISPDSLRLADDTFQNTSCDLVIFSVRHRLYSGAETTEHTFVLDNALYPAPADFLATLARKRRLLIYSAGNKFYRRSLLELHGITFDQSRAFGEDRLFNYAYLRHCQAIATRADIIYDYHVHSAHSLSNRFRDQALHEALFIHAEKRALFTHFKVAGSDVQAFLIHDLGVELRETLHHFRRHWTRLGRHQRGRILHDLTAAGYPPYLKDVPMPTRRGRLIISALRHRRRWLLRLLLHPLLGFK